VRLDVRPDSVALAAKSLFGGALKPVRAVPVVRDSTGSEAAPWRAGVEAAAALLSQTTRGGSSVEAVISSEFVRYLLVPWSESLVRDSERLAFSRLAFREVYGAVTDAWEICIDDQRANEPALACAIDRDLLAALQSAAKTAGATLNAVTPALADCVNRHRRVLKGSAFCLANAEERRMTFLFVQGGVMRAVRSRRIDGAADEQLAALLKQEASASGMQEGGTLYICASRPADFAGLAVPGWKVALLADPVRAHKPPIEPALAPLES
jgi:hypothetical protein